jgi:glycosyltransferase involved in cell wall biosynthesis
VGGARGPGRLRILLTNRSLEQRAGSELYLFELATRLLARGHSPLAFSPRLGRVAEALRSATIPVVDDLGAIGEPPDLIHGQHHLAAMTAMLHFPRVPGLFVCHGWQPWEETPPRFPRFLRYVAVDFTTRERLVSERGIPPERVEVVLNFVDLDRFQLRPPLPPRPRRALVFSNQASERTFLPAVREACSRFGIAVDVIGVASGGPVERPEELLPAYDLVFAKGRAALEAMAVGAAVVLCDQAGSGPLVTSGDFDRLRPLNFGIRALRNAVTPDSLASQIERYDPKDAAEVSRRLRATAGIDQAVDRMIALYEEVLAEHRERGNPPPEEESRAASAYLRWLSPYFDEREWLGAEVARLGTEAGHRGAEVDRLDGEAGRLGAEKTHLGAEVGRLSADKTHLSAEATRLRQEIQALQSTATWRMRDRLLRITPVLRAYRFLRGSDRGEG